MKRTIMSKEQLEKYKSKWLKQMRRYQISSKKWLKCFDRVREAKKQLKIR